MAKYRVSLTPEERANLEQFVSVGKRAARKLAHARILLLADTTSGKGRSDDAIVDALGIGLRTIERVRQRFVTGGLEAAVAPKPQPPRPDKIKIKGDIEQKLVQLACSDPPEGRCHWTLELLADELVVLGLVDSLSTETVRQALKKTTSSRGSSIPGASPPRPMPTTSGGWKTSSRRTFCLTIRSGRWSVSTKPASNCSVKCGHRSCPVGALPPARIMSTSGKVCATNS